MVDVMGRIPIDEDILRKMGAQLEPGGLLKLRLSGGDGKSTASLDEIVELVRSGSVRVEVDKYYNVGAISVVANRLFDELGPDASSVSLIPVVILQAATVECLVNDLVIDWCRSRYPNAGRRLTDAFLDGSVRSKLLRVVPMYTDGKIQLNSSQRSVQDIYQLISTRDRLVHVTEHYSVPGGPEKPSLVGSLSVDRVGLFKSAVVDLIDALWNVLHKDPPWEHSLFCLASEGGFDAGGEV
jgi:hypothetical protein